MSVFYSKKMLAKALYDNEAETPDELAFRRGDIVTVLAQDASGLEGWWLCSLRGRQGIAPFNRLKLLDGLYGEGGGGGGRAGNHADVVRREKGNAKADVRWTRRSWLIDPNKVVTPQKLGNVYVYNQGCQDEMPQDYDVPTSRYFPDSKTLPNGRGTLPLPELPNEAKVGSSAAIGQTSVLVEEPAYSVPQSNRSSTVSMLSTGSNNTVSSSNSHANLQVGSSSPAGGHSARSSAEVPGEEMYDVPPANPKSAKVPEQTPLEIFEMYDLPSKVKADIEKQGGITLKPHSDSSPMDFYDTPSKAKQQHSLDSSILDVYEFSPSKEEADMPALPVKPRTMSLSSRQEEPFSLPPKLTVGSGGKSLDKSLEDDYDLPKADSMRSSGDSGIEKMEMLYDIPPLKGSIESMNIDATCDVPMLHSAAFTTAMSRFAGAGEASRESAGNESGGVYDIPPQVTRDSTFSTSVVLSVEEVPSTRVSTCSTDSRGSDIPSVPYEQLPLHRDSALETLVKLQQDLEKACSHLLSFVNSSWRMPDKLEPNLFGIKLATLAVKAALQQVVDFGHGALANSARVQDKKLVRNLFRHLEPLQTSLQDVKNSLQNLSSKWDLSCLSSKDDVQPADALTFIVNEAKDMPSKIRTFASIIQGNASLLFKKADDTPVVMRDKPAVKSKPPPPPIKPKPKTTKGSSENVSTDGSVTPTSLGDDRIQSRPLPVPPPAQEGVYDVPKSSTSKGKSALCQKSFKEEDLAADYDYVDLTQEAMVAEAGVVTPKELAGPGDKSVSELHDTSRDSQISMLSLSDIGSSGSIKPVTVRTSGLSEKFKERLETLQAQAQEQVQVHTENDENGVTADMNTLQRRSHLHENDRQILGFYASQITTHSTVLVNAIDAFFQCVDYNQPPRLFIAHSKFVILGAHKMVYIADTLSRYTYSEEVRDKITACANLLCNCLKSAVTSTKQAALQYPALRAVQDMVDKVVDVSHAANELKLVIVQASQL